ncbi:protein of unknown function (DUF4292) [Cyclonatronum proteinivorum]|uniref:Outer membrane lipoprotein-sorting protein n=1 Tax=Cyclonatronum proteinivorum TaxID=1457365 RepID=A0A345UPB5_9BACT|nr:DUF4292 domain-containing protein [Cyclonatronum proteinivorum]AXJ02317.1 protein of unknown function (DUF4292) [Cyclonatronum proteinivorum]
MKNLIPDFRAHPGLHRAIWLIGVTLLAGLAACSPRMAPPELPSDFSRSTVSADSLLPLLQTDFAAIEALSGRASARISQPGQQDQATVHFTSSRNESLLTLRNNLGIEGGRIYTDTDSVTLYDRIERTAWRMSAEQARLALLQGFTAFNLLEFLLPELTPDQITGVYESTSEWVLRMADERYFLFDKNSLYLTRLIKPASSPLAYSQFSFSHHASIEGFTLPRRIEILSEDGKARIFLLIQALELNPPNPSFDIGLPADLPLERR